MTTRGGSYYRDDHETPPIDDRRPSYRDLLEFVTQTAALLKDGEPNEEGEEFDLTSDDAVDTMHSLIRQARGLLDLPDGQEEG